MLLLRVILIWLKSIEKEAKDMLLFGVVDAAVDPAASKPVRLNAKEVRRRKPSWNSMLSNAV